MGAEWVVCNRASIYTDLQRGGFGSWDKRFKGDDGGVCAFWIMIHTVSGNNGGFGEVMRGALLDLGRIGR
jgi:hypothetical protein